MSGKEPAIVTGDKESVDTWRQALIEAEDTKQTKLKALLRRQQCRGCWCCFFIILFSFCMGFFLYQQPNIHWTDFKANVTGSDDDYLPYAYEMHLRYNNPNYYPVTFEKFDIKLRGFDEANSDFESIGVTSVPEVTCAARSLCYEQPRFKPEKKNQANYFVNLTLGTCCTEEGAHMVATGSCKSTNGLSLWNVFVGQNFYWKCSYEESLDCDSDA